MLCLSLVFSLDSAPQLLINLVLIEITARIASAPAKQINGVPVRQQNMRVSRRRYQHSRKIYEGPRFRLEVEEIEIVQLSSAIMPAKKIHFVIEDGCRGPIPALRPHAITSDLLPHIRLEVVLVKVISVVAIISSEDVHVVLVDDAGVRVSGAGALFGVKRLELLPCARLYAISMEVINSIITIVATENINAASVDHRCVPVARARRLRTSVRVELAPIIRRKVEAKEVISAISAIVASEDIEVVIEGD